MMNQRLIVPAVLFVVVGVVVVAVLNWVIKMHGGVEKVLIGAVIGLIVAGIAYAVMPKPAT